jgi:hypothetical protein
MENKEELELLKIFNIFYLLTNPPIHDIII